MRNLKNLILLAALLLLAIPQAEPRLGYLTIGPMLHWNFSDYQIKSFSYGLEAAWWTYRKAPDEDAFFYANLPDPSSPGFGWDLGFEADWKSFRLYSEPQVGWVYAGLSAGPVFEISREDGSARWGVQGSGWLNALVGFDFRYRYLSGTHTQAVGNYAKVGTLISGRDSDFT